METRLRCIRKTLKLSQEEFGKMLGITKSGVSDIESGRRNVTEQHILMLKMNCKGFNEHWLRTGEGEMFNSISKDEEIAEFLADVTLSDDKSFKKRLITALAKMDENGWNELEKLLDDIYSDN